MYKSDIATQLTISALEQGIIKLNKNSSDDDNVMDSVNHHNAKQISDFFNTIHNTLLQD